MGDDISPRLPKVPTYIWHYTKKEPMRSKKPAEDVFPVESPPETSKAARTIISKYGHKTRIRLSNSTEAQSASSTAVKAIKHVARLRPQKDMEGAITRKWGKRKLPHQLARQRKLRAADAKTRKLGSKVKRSANIATNSDEGNRETLFENLTAQVVYSVRGTRKYTHARVERIAKIGTSPSDGGSRSAIESILSHNGDQLCGKVTSRMPASGDIPLRGPR